MKTLQNIIQAKETKTELQILLTNGKIMFVDFGDNTICRFSLTKGNEQTREFNTDTNKMFKLAVTYLKKQ
jgi:hypothetical protein